MKSTGNLLNGQKRNVNHKKCQKLRETQPLSPWKVKTNPRVSLWSLLSSIDNQRTQVVRLVVVLCLSTSRNCLWRNRETARRVMALGDSGCNTTLIHESLALSLGLQGKEVDLEIQEVNAKKVFTSQHIKKCMSHESEKRKSITPCRTRRQFLA